MSKKKKPDHWELERERQKIAKEEELKAKLAMVELKDKPSYGRAPRKIGEMICKVGFKNGYREETARFVLRLDEKAGDFIAEHGDFWYVSKSREALQAKMDEVARFTSSLEWTRYIRIEYEATVPYTDSWRSYGSTTELGVDDKRDKNLPILGISLKWEIVEYSQAIHLPGDEGERYMMREVDKDGDVKDEQESKTSLPAGLVVWTSERENFLKGIRLAFADLDKKMIALFGGTPEQVAKRLDTANGPLLLAAPKKGK